MSTTPQSSVIAFDRGEFVHLGLGASISRLPTHTGDMDWYQAYGQAHGDDGVEGRLVSLHTFTESWDTWEMHPSGHELVLCTGGRVTLTQESPDGNTSQTTLEAGAAVVNDPGVWHTADVAEGDSATVVFITAGLGTEMRPR